MNEKRICRLMRLMGLMPIHQQPETSKPAKEHETYPTSCAGCVWSGQVRSGAWTSTIFRCAAGFSIW